MSVKSLPIFWLPFIFWFTANSRFMPPPPPQTMQLTRIMLQGHLENFLSFFIMSQLKQKLSQVMSQEILTSCLQCCLIVVDCLEIKSVYGMSKLYNSTFKWSSIFTGGISSFKKSLSPPSWKSVPQGECEFSHAPTFSVIFRLGQNKYCYIGVTRPTLKLGPTLHLKKKKNLILALKMLILGFETWLVA